MAALPHNHLEHTRQTAVAVPPEPGSLACWKEEKHGGSEEMEKRERVRVRKERESEKRSEQGRRRGRRRERRREREG